MQKIVAVVMCLSLLASTQAFVSSDAMGGILMMNMLRGGGGLGGLGGLFGGGRPIYQATRPAVGQQGKGTGATPNVVQMQQRQRNPFGSLLNLAILSEGGLF